jgi:1-acyl-sn-glycerol-3-phosphate acyltransferase
MFLEILRERSERLGKGSTLARCLLGFTRRVSLGVSPALYRMSCVQQFYRTCQSYGPVVYEGLENIPLDRPCLFVMKHRGFSDITMHGMGYALATSGSVDDLVFPDCWSSKTEIVERVKDARLCRFVMKEDLLSLPIGLHLVLNGGIPVPQDLETKAKNTPGFDPKAPKVLEQQKKMSGWFNFKDSFREITNTLKGGDAVMIYGEATRVSGEKMGHLSERMIQRLAKSNQAALIPVGSEIKDGEIFVRYGQDTEMDELRESIARLSGIPLENFLP